MKKMYEAEMHAEIAKFAHCINNDDVFTEADIAHLPTPLRRYFHYSGYLGKPKMVNAEVIWADSAIKMAEGRAWMPLKTYQFNSVPRPFRIAYMQATIMGVIPFEGRDIYTSETGNMRGKLMNVITLFDNKDPELAQSGLATTFAESFLIPAYILQPYITWESIDDNTARGYIQYNGLSVHATFYFDDEGKMTRFYTQDRYMALPKRQYAKIPFSAVCGEYIERDGIRFASKLTARWHLDTGDFDYFTGTIAGMRYNLK